jgi:hypothetical protein
MTTLGQVFTLETLAGNEGTRGLGTIDRPFILNDESAAMKKALLRAVIEIAFIIFLFYANLLMGEYTHSGAGRARGLVWAIRDVLTGLNFAIAITAAVIGYFVFEFLRKRL